jgi:hypothetical protein
MEIFCDHGTEISDFIKARNFVTTNAAIIVSRNTLHSEVGYLVLFLLPDIGFCYKLSNG